MDPIVDLAPGADSSPLAQQFASRIKRNVEDPRLRRAFFALKATIFLVDFDAGETISLRFDHGRLTAHEGPIGVPSVTFGGPRVALDSLERARLRDLPAALLGMRRAPVSLVETRDGRPSSPPPGQPEVRLDVAGLGRLLLNKELRVYGIVSHPRTVYRFLQLVAAPD